MKITWIDYISPRQMFPNLDGSPDSYLRVWDACDWDGLSFPVPDAADQCTRVLLPPSRVPALPDYLRLLAGWFLKIILSLLAAYYSGWWWLLLAVSFWFVVSVLDLALRMRKWSALVGEYDGILSSSESVKLS